MPTIKRRFGLSAVRAFILVGALGVSAGGLNATPEEAGDGAVQTRASPESFLGCVAGRDFQRFDVERGGGGIRTLDLCDTRDRGDISATARALSAAIDAAPPLSGVTADPRTINILELRLMRARTELNTRIDPDARDRKLLEIDRAIKVLEEQIS